ncbi:hypothetical protein ERX37_07930 [Macrococcus hajekii]|uniref:Uncharacterized protein n=1 Tax=Macrococcus hajekii TaxID=198482 RepID=A0A4R6BIU6_9STAP|nr:hypothetical protein [Macrococcus hajekii]TDM01421.1 hypothetical protein ERX37_07930 [Macrococcus hajekii]GGA99838.1 hypothetical protein GCM10007190_04860 [Macrococcus hajekii]
MQNKEEKRLSVGAIIEDKRSFKRYKVTGMNKRIVCFESIRGPLFAGGVWKSCFDENFRIIKEGWQRAGK